VSSLVEACVTSALGGKSASEAGGGGDLGRAQLHANFQADHRSRIMREDNCMYSVLLHKLFKKSTNDAGSVQKFCNSY
jgi:hypothetical protein